MLSRLLSFLLIIGFGAFALVACNEDTIAPPADDASAIGIITPEGPALSVPQSNLSGKFLKTFDVSEIELVTITTDEVQKGVYYLFAKGPNSAEGAAENSVRIMRFNTEVRNGKIYLPITKSFGESCSGVNCQECAFKPEGGCTCRVGGDPHHTSICNHTITKET